MSKICFPKYGGPCPQWLASPVIRVSSNSMQPDAKVEKMRSQSGRLFVFVKNWPSLSGSGKIDCRKRRVEVEGQFSKVSRLTVRNSRELFAVPVQIMCNFSWRYSHLTVDWLFCIVE